MISKCDKWSKDQIELLIDAIKDEQCLFASNLPIYHNKHLRGEAMERVYQKVVRLRPTTTKDECQKKFLNLRNQFNIENAKVKSSLRSRTGTDDVYTPNLWYFSLLLFLDTYVTPRKSQNSLEHVQNPVSESSSSVIYVSESQILTNDLNSVDQQQQLQLLIPVHQSTVTTDAQEDSSSSILCNTANLSTSTSSTSEIQQNIPTFITPGPISPALLTSSSSETQQNNYTFIASGPISPALSTSSSSETQNNPTFIIPGPISPTLSTSSTSGVSSGTQRKSKKRPRQESTDDDFSGAINSLAESLRQPIIMTNSENTQQTRQSMDCYRL